MWSPNLYVGNHICGRGYQLPLISIKPIFENISSKADQKTTVACYQTCYANWTKGSIHESIWKNQHSPTVFLHDAKNHKYWAAARHYARYRSNTNNKLTFQKVWHSLTVSNPSSHVRLFCWAFFCSASTQTVLMHMVGTTEYKGHLNLKCSTTKRHIKTTLLRPMYSLQAGEFIHQDVTMI